MGLRNEYPELAQKPFSSDSGAGGWFVAIGLVYLGKSIEAAARIIADSKKDLR